MHQRPPHLHDVVMTALETGCRKQELLTLQWSQVHWEQNELFLPGTKTKTKRPRRIPISTALHEILVRRLVRPTGESYDSQDYVFGDCRRYTSQGHQDGLESQLPTCRYRTSPVP